jgi:ketosteroid isomerase-like protein
MVVLADMPMRAQASGIALSEKYACVSTLKAGRIVQQRDFLNQGEALQAVGLSA